MAPPSAAGPPPHPPPPADLARRDLPLVEVAGPWLRSYRLAYTPLYFGCSGRERFDAPDGRYGVCYAGDDDACAFIETFGHQTGRRVVTVSELLGRGRARLTAGRPLRLVDLRGPGLARLGADNALAAGSDYGTAQAWSAALWSHPAAPDGLLYWARHDPSLTAVALFDRVELALVWEELGSWYDPAYRRDLGALLDRYNFGLIDDRA